MAKLTHTVSSNNVASFRSADIANIESLKCHFLPVQEGSGNPSPENIRPISGWNNINITQCSFNLFNKNEDYSENNFYYKSDGTTVIDNNYRTTGYIKIKPSTAYFWAIDGVDGIITVGHSAPRVAFFDINKTWIGSSDALVQGRSMVSPSNAAYARLPVYVREEIAVASAMFVEGNSMPTTYESYCGSTIPIIFPTTGKNKLNPADIYIYDNHFTLNNGVYTSTVTDTRDYTQLSVQLWKTRGSYLKTLYVDYLKTTGRHTLTFTVDDPNGQYICLKHNGIKKDFILLFPVPLGLRQYTISLDLIANDPTTIGGVQLTNIQLEVGDTATGYEPYVNNLNNTIYGGYVDLVNGTIVQEYDSYTFTGIEEDALNYHSTSTNSGAERYIFQSTKLDRLPQNTSTSLGYYNTCISTVNMNANTDVGIYIGTPTHQVIFYIKSTLCDNTVESFSAWLSNHPIQVVYKLKNPIVHYLNNEQIKTFLDKNNIWSNANDIIEVEYSIIDHLVQKRMNIPKACRKVLWNQLCPPLDADNWKDYSTTGLTSTTFNGGIATHEYLADNKGLYSVSICQKIIPTVTANHIYYASYMICPDHSLRCGLEFANNQYAANRFTVPANTWQQCSFVAQCITTGYGNLYIPNPNQEDIYSGYINLIKSPIYIDLTRMFGAGQEPTLNEFEAMCRINHIDLTQYHAQDVAGTEMIWYTNNCDITKYNIIEWNQIIKDGNFTNSSNWSWGNNYTVTFANNQATLHRDEDTGGTASIGIVLANRKTSIPGHKYLFYVSVQTINGTLNISPTGTVADGHATYGSFPTKTTRKWIWECNVTKTIVGELRGYVGSGTTTAPIDFIAENYMIFDLTQMYGAGNEPTITEFERQCNLNNISLDTNLPYDTGTKQLWIT